MTENGHYIKSANSNAAEIFADAHLPVSTSSQ